MTTTFNQPVATPANRIVAVDDLPASLWSKKTLYIAPRLATAYCAAIHAHGLRGLADARDPDKSPVGGPTKESADEHFAQAFDGSVARTQLALLDPKSEVSHVADSLACFLAGGRVAVLDLPSGAGAFALSVLCTLAELRASGVVPRQPLDVVVVGGEFNPHASNYAIDMYGQVRGALEAQAIIVEFKVFKWDVCDRVSTTEMVKQFVADAERADRKLVAVSNFSGFLAKEKKQKDAERQLEEIFRYSSGKHAIALWLEPKTNAASKNLFPWIQRAKEMLWSFVHSVTGSSKASEALAETETQFSLSLHPERVATARLSVVRFALRAPVR